MHPMFRGFSRCHPADFFQHMAAMGRHGHGGWGGEGPFGPGPGGGGHGGRGGRRERVFEGGDFKLLVLHLLQAQEPRHGYELMKAIGELVGEGYTPSPGAIYPTLAYLEDEGFIAVEDAEAARKRYRLTDEGRAHLASQAEAVQRTLARLQALQGRSGRHQMPEIVRAMENLKVALRLTLADGAADPELVRKVAGILDRAAVEIQRR